MNLLQDRESVVNQIKTLQDKLESIDDQILEAVKDKVPQMGSATLEYEGHKITVTIPKITKWDQMMLKQIAAKIQASGDDPEMYIEYALKVKEALYKAWPEQVQAVFIPARTVTPGKRRIEVRG